jgi:hypothetical protein
MTRRLFLAALAAAPLAALRPPVPVWSLIRWTPRQEAFLRRGKSKALWTVVAEQVRGGESVLWIEHSGVIYQCDQAGTRRLTA